jgi:hypothetical protein
MYFNKTIEKIPAPQALDRAQGKKIWEISEEFVKLTNQ